MKRILLPASLASFLLSSAPIAQQGSVSPNTTRKFSGVVVRTIQTDEVIPARGGIGGISVDDQGRFYIANFGRAVRRIDPDGSQVLLNNNFTVASGNSIGNDGVLLQSEFQLNRVYRVFDDGSRTIVANTGLSGPVGVVQHPNDDIYVVNCNNNTISRIDPGGTVSQFSADPLLSCPNGIVVDDQGDIYVVNWNDDNLLRLDSGGNATIVATVGSGLNSAHMTFANGKFYVAKLFRHEIWEVTKAGQAKKIVGAGLGTRDGFAPHQAQLDEPNGMTSAPDGTVYTNNLAFAQVFGTGGRLLIRSIHFE